MPNIQQIFPIGRDRWRARAITAEAAIDGSGTAVVQFQRTEGLDWSGGAQVTSIVVTCENGTPTETYNLFIKHRGETTPRYLDTLVITAAVTKFPQDDMYIPPHADVFLSSVGGKDGNVCMNVDRYA